MREFALETSLLWGGVACYIVAFALLVHAVVFARPARVPWVRWPLAIGLVPHGAAIVLRWIAVGHGPYMMKYEVFASNTWIALAALLLFLWRRPAWAAMGLVVLPLSILGMAVGVFSSPEARALPPTLRSAWLVFHITFAKLAAAAFLLSLATAVLVVLKSRPRPPAWSERLPGIDVLDANEVRFVGFGFILWTVTVAAGAIWANQSWGRYWGWDAIETWSLVAWLTYGSWLHARLFFRPKPLTSAWLAIGAFLIFVLTLLVLPYVIPTLHSAYMQ